ncbi:MAG: hypothetical protein JNL11_05760 [Bdellovibrionaceae bacterium]|nr:hypothetical protein [Pseudobdellovibrionaceae bacterium]
MKVLLITLFVAMAGLAQVEYPNDLTKPSNPPYPQNPPTNPPMSTDTVNTTSSTDSSRVRSEGGLFIEPMLLTVQEDSTIKTSQLPIITDDTSGTSSGFGVGLRFGGHVSEVFLLGVDARYTKMRMSDSFYESADSNAYNIAPVVGVQTPYYGIRLLAGYVVAGENNPDAGVQGLNLKFTEATGWRVGAGIHIAAVSVNVEYQDLTYNATQVESLGSLNVNNTTSVDANNRGYTVSLSFPVEL